MFVFFHLRRFDGVLEPDVFGLDIDADRLPYEALAGAKGLICEAIMQGLPLLYRQFEVRSQQGADLLSFPFTDVIRYDVRASAPLALVA